MRLVRSPRRSETGLGPLLGACLLVQAGRALRVTNFDLPQIALQGDTIQLGCAFTLGRADGRKSPLAAEQTGAGRASGAPSEQAAGELLYAVKWYKDEREFFRFLAQDWPHKQALPMEGVHVDVSATVGQLQAAREADHSGRRAGQLTKLSLSLFLSSRWKSPTIER